jgi:mannitol/fructose-specific phosphotransferase system IIA component (Ntr-type)
MSDSPAPEWYLSDLLTPATVQLNLQGVNRDAVLAELIHHIPSIAGQPAAQQTLLRALQEREELHSTGIGDGIALPHARNALVGMVDRAVIVFGRHPTGVHYAADDRVPAKVFFLLVATNVSEHLRILARISRLLRTPKLRQDLLKVDKAENVIRLLRETEQGMGR